MQSLPFAFLPLGCPHAARVLALWLALAGVPLASAQPLTFSHIADFSGRGKSIAAPIHQGAVACIAAYNEAARPDRQVRLEALDDRFDPALSATLANDAARRGTHAFVASLGTAPTLAIAEVAARFDLPVLGPVAGASSVRAKRHPSLFFVRASLAAEAAHAVRHLHAMGIRRIGAFHTSDTFGQDGVAAVLSKASSLGLPPPLQAAYDPATAADAGEAPEQLRSMQAVIMFGSSRVLYDFVRRIRRLAPSTVLLAASAANMTELIQVVGVDDARGIGYLRSLPAPSARTALGREFREVWRKHGTTTEPTPFHLEGCLAVRLGIQAALSTHRAAAPGALTRALRSLPAQRFGEFHLDFARGGQEGSSWVGIAVVDGSGHLRD